MTPVHRTAALALASCLSGACGADAPTAADPRATASAPATTATATTATATTPTPTPAQQATAPAHGYGDRIAWRSLEDGMKEAARLGRPLMLVVHARWCPRCRELKPRFFDPAVAETSERLVMVNVDQDDSPEVQRLGPDGQYIPRILFFDPAGNLDAGLSNPGRSKYKYFYTPQDDLVGMMNQAIDRHAKAARL